MITKNVTLKALWLSIIMVGLVATQTLTGQVVYTDVNPDVVVATGDSYEIDFNADNNYELKISAYVLIVTS